MTGIKNVFRRWLYLGVRGRPKGQETLRQCVAGVQVVHAVQVAHVWRLVLVILVVPGYRVGVVVVGLAEGRGGQHKVFPHGVAGVHPVLGLRPNIVLVVVFLHFGLSEARCRQPAVPPILWSGAGTAQRRQDAAEEVRGLQARLLHVIIGDGGVDVVVPGSALLSGLAATSRLPLGLGHLEPLLSPEVTAVLEHVARVRVERPETTLARLVGGARHFHKTVVERERVSEKWNMVRICLGLVTTDESFNQLMEIERKQIIFFILVSLICV